jgi:hypothetical protein
MKSYDEALDTMQAPLSASPEVIERLEQNAMRGFPISDEVIANPRTATLITAIVEAVKGSELCKCEGCRIYFSIGMTAYLNGIRVGIEMEKNELREGIEL